MNGSRAVPSDRPVRGLLCVDKPVGITSHDVVANVRRAARTKRVGHAGTLDPFATGLLVIAVGACTRLLPYVQGEPKVYEALIRFGQETDTDDRTGTVVRHAATPAALGWPVPLPEAIASLTGDVLQVPPAFSAKHVDGHRAYALARRGVEVVLEPVPVAVHRWDVLDRDDNAVRVRITCRGGTYVRALARDLGRALRSAAHCEALRRVSSGAASVDASVSMAALEPGSIADGRVALHAPLAFLAPMAHVPLDAPALEALAHGRSLAATHQGARAALLRDGDVVGIADRVRDQSGARWQPRVVLLNGDA